MADERHHRGVVYSAGELAVDRAIHWTGIVIGAAGAVILLWIAAGRPAPAIYCSCLIYAICLLAMLMCSASYNLAMASPRRALLRRLDHAVIFLLIAGTYTPFTVCKLGGLWAIGMTAAIWLLAITGAVLKLACPHRLERGSTLACLALGWMIVVGARPLLAAVDMPTVVLIAVGGICYSIGAGIHLWRSLRFHNAMWHGLVLIAAACHYTAILHGVVLA
jgi:hemolysin III